jgi:hypothetical protein
MVVAGDGKGQIDILQLTEGFEGELYPDLSIGVALLKGGTDILEDGYVQAGIAF